MPTWSTWGTGNWNDAARWTGGVPNNLTAIANFVLNGASGVSRVRLAPNATTTVGELNVTLNGPGGLIIEGSTGNSVLRFDNASFGNNLTVNNSAATGSFAISDVGGLTIESQGGLNVDVSNLTGIATFLASVTTTSGLDKSGAGTLVLGRTNAFTGNIRIFAGTLEAFGDAALGSTTLLCYPDTVFRSSGIIDNLIAAGSSTGTYSTSLVASLGNTMTLAGDLNFAGGKPIAFGSASDTGTVVAAFSVLGYNIFSADFVVAGGTLRFGNTHNAENIFALRDSGRVTVETAAILDTGGFVATLGNLDMNGGTLRSSTGILDVVINQEYSLSSPTIHTGTIEGTAGADRLVVNATLAVNMAALVFNSWSANDTITITGTSGNNTITGSSQRDTINGNDGNDLLTSGGGIDTIIGGIGDDTIVVDAASSGSFLDGDSGNDMLRVASGGVTLGSVARFERIGVLSGATLQLSGAQFTDGFAFNSVLSGTGRIQVDLDLGASALLFRSMTEAAGADVKFTINGTSGNDIIKASDFTTDTINGGAGLDLINGGSGDDIINGGADIDKIRGDGGADILSGDAGADVFKFRNVSDSGIGTAADRILDFVSGSDRLNFSRIDTSPALPGDQGFSFIGIFGFTGTGSAQIRYSDLGADLRVDVDVNGDGFADMQVLLKGAGMQTLTAADFVL